MCAPATNLDHVEVTVDSSALESFHVSRQHLLNETTGFENHVPVVSPEIRHVPLAPPDVVVR